MAITLPEVTKEAAEKGLVSRYEVYRLGQNPRVIIEVTEVSRIRGNVDEGETEFLPTPFGKPAYRAIEKAKTWRFEINSNSEEGLAEIVAMTGRIAGRVQAQLAQGRFDVDEAQAEEGEAIAGRYFAGESMMGINVTEL